MKNEANVNSEQNYDVSLKTWQKRKKKMFHQLKILLWESFSCCVRLWGVLILKFSAHMRNKFPHSIPRRLLEVCRHKREENRTQLRVSHDAISKHKQQKRKNKKKKLMTFSSSRTKEAENKFLFFCFFFTSKVNIFHFGCALRKRIFLWYSYYQFLNIFVVFLRPSLHSFFLIQI
jgi:hypothetical protein